MISKSHHPVRRQQNLARIASGGCTDSRSDGDLGERAIWEHQGSLSFPSRGANIASLPGAEKRKAERSGAEQREQSEAKPISGRVVHGLALALALAMKRKHT